MKIRIAAVICLTLLVAVWAGYAAASPKALTIAQGVDVSTLDPHMSNDTPTSNVMFNIFDALLARDQKMQLIPALAKEYSQISDHTWRFVLEEGVQFHNGELFDAAAVKFSLERVLDPETRSPQAAGIRHVTNIEIVDQFTVEIHTAEPYPLLPAQLASIAMVPPKYIAEQGVDQFRRHPVGTGPYQFSEWKKDERLILAANPDYFRGEPAIQQVTFRPVPETATRIAELQSGAVDLIVNLPPHQVPVLERQANLAVRTAPSARILFIVLTTIEEGPLQNVKVRQALNYAVDKEAIIDAILGGYGENIAVPVPKVAYGYHTGLEPYPYDPAKARQLLAEAGYPDGFDVVFEAPSGRYLMDREVGQAVNAFFQDIGVKTDFAILEWGVFVGKLYEKAGATMMLLGLGSSTLDADSYLFGQLRTGQISSYFSDPEIDELLDRQRTEMDPQARLELLYRIQELAHERAVLIPLYQQVDIYGVQEAVVFQPRSDERLLVAEMDVR